MSCRRGLGAINVGPLAQAQFSGQIHPSWAPPPMVLSGVDPNPQPLPNWLYPTQSFAEQIASLLGGSAIQAPPAYNFGEISYNGQETNVLPDAWQVSVDGQNIMPGGLIYPNIVLSFEDECDAESYFSQEIPGSQLSPTCASGGTGTTPAELAVQQGAVPPCINGVSTIVGYTCPPAASTAVPKLPAPVTSSTPTIPAGASTVQPLNLAPPAPSQIAASLPGSNVTGSNAGGPAPIAPQSNGSQLVQTSPASSDIVIGGFDLSTIPWYVWAAGGAALLFALSGKG